MKRYTSMDIADAILAGEVIGTDEFIPAADCAALAVKCANLEHAMLTERGKLEKADAENDRLAAKAAELEAVLRESMRGHYQCEDPWYSCPLNPDGCADERETECNCGASAWNAKVLACFPTADPDKQP